MLEWALGVGAGCLEVGVGVDAIAERAGGEARELALMAVGVFGLRRSRRTAVLRD